MLWDTFDCPIIPDDDFTEVFLITKSALEEKGIITGVYGSVEFRAFVGDMDECPGFPVFWIDKGEFIFGPLSFVLFLCVSIDYIYYMQQLRAKMIDFGASLHSYLLRRIIIHQVQHS